MITQWLSDHEARRKSRCDAHCHGMFSCFHCELKQINNLSNDRLVQLEIRSGERDSYNETKLDVQADG